MRQRCGRIHMSDVRLPTQSGNAVTVRGLTPELKARLRVRAAHNGRSMEAEARAILEASLSAPDDETTDLGAFARGLIAPIGGIDLALPARGPQRQPPELGDDTTVTSDTVKSSATAELVESEQATAAATETSPKTIRGRRR
jgi:plasmid stability protein